MIERIDRKTDEKIYQPKIHSELIKELYIIRQISGLPMTVLVHMAIREFIANYNTRVCEENDIYTYEKVSDKEDL